MFSLIYLIFHFSIPVSAKDPSLNHFLFCGRREGGRGKCGRFFQVSSTYNPGKISHEGVYTEESRLSHCFGNVCKEEDVKRAVCKGRLFVCLFVLYLVSSQILKDMNKRIFFPFFFSRLLSCIRLNLVWRRKFKSEMFYVILMDAGYMKEIL